MRKIKLFYKWRWEASIENKICVAGGRARAHSVVVSAAASLSLPVGSSAAESVTRRSLLCRCCRGFWDKKRYQRLVSKGAITLFIISSSESKKYKPSPVIYPASLLKISSSSEDSLSCSFSPRVFLRVALRGLYMSRSQSGAASRRSPPRFHRGDMLVLLLPCSSGHSTLSFPKPTWLSLVPELSLTQQESSYWKAHRIGNHVPLSVSHSVFALVLPGLNGTSVPSQWAKSQRPGLLRITPCIFGFPEALRVCQNGARLYLWGDSRMWLSMACRHDCSPTHFSALSQLPSSRKHCTAMLGSAPPFRSIPRWPPLDWVSCAAFAGVGVGRGEEKCFCFLSCSIW